jgi:hypothetical protein
MKGKTASFRVGKVSAFRRSKVWYLCYSEGGRRRRPRVGPDRDLARQMAAPETPSDGGTAWARISKGVSWPMQKFNLNRQFPPVVLSHCQIISSC